MKIEQVALYIIRNSDSDPTNSEAVISKLSEIGSSSTKSVILAQLHPFPFKTESTCVDVSNGYDLLKQTIDRMEALVGYPTFIDITLVSAPMYVFLLETDEFKLPEKNEFIEKLFKDVPRDAKAIVINALQKKKTSALEDFLKKKFTNVEMATTAISANNEKPEGEQEDKQKSVGTLNSQVLEASDRIPVRRKAPSFTNETQEDTIIKRRSPVFTNVNADSTFDKRRPPVFTDGNTESIVVQRRVPSNENDIPTRPFSRRQPLAATPENPAASSSQEKTPIRKNIKILSMAEIPPREENASIPQNPNENPISSAKGEFEERDEDEDEDEDYDEDEDED